MSQGTRELISDGGFDLEKTALSDIDNTIHAIVQIEPKDSKWRFSEKGALILFGKNWLKQHDAQWPADIISNAILLSGAAGNDSGEIFQTIFFTRSGNFTLTLLLRAGIKDFGRESECHDAVLEIDFPNGSTSIASNKKWVKTSYSGSLTRLEKDVKFGQMTFSFKEKSKKAPCASAIAALSVKYSTAASAILVSPSTTPDGKLMVEADHDVEALRFIVTEGTGGPPLSFAWVEFSLTKTGFGLQFKNTDAVILQCDERGTVTLPVGSLHAGVNVNRSLQLAVGGDTALTLPVASAKSANVTKLEIISPNPQYVVMGEPVDFIPLTIKATDMNNVGVPNAVVTYVITSEGGGATQCRLSQATQATDSGGNATINVIKGTVAEVFSVKATCNRSTVVFELALLPLYGDLELRPSVTQSTLHRQSSSTEYYATLVTRGTTQGWPYVSGSVRADPSTGLKVTDSPLKTDLKGRLQPDVTVKAITTGDHKLIFRAEPGRQRVETTIHITVVP